MKSNIDLNLKRWKPNDLQREMLKDRRARKGSRLLTLPIEKIGLVKVLPDSLIVGLRWRAMVEVELGLIATILARSQGSESLLLLS